jgi:hypothetical protein
MTKNLLILDREQAICNYQKNMMFCLQDFLKFEDSSAPRSFLKSLGNFYLPLKDMLSDDLEVSRTAFGESFSRGETMMMMDSEQEKMLDEWSEGKEEFQIAIFTRDGRPIGVFKKDSVCW